jgi:hypothetical protein
LHQASLVAAAGLQFPNIRAAAADSPATAPTTRPVRNAPQTILSDPRVRLSFGTERMILDDGLQPSMLRTASGALVVQAQLSRKPHSQKRIFYPYALSTVVSRDAGETWREFPLKPGDNGVNMEGGAIQLKDGTILVLETYVTPGTTPGTGAGLLYQSSDDYRTLEGPIDVTFNLPRANFFGSTDDGGRPHAAMRLHRRILELPGGDLLTTLYGWLEGDDEPSGYTPTMRKTRVILLRSKNRGRHWDLVSTIAAGRNVGTEGYGEATLVRVSNPNAPANRRGRLICMMRTGHELREAFSDDKGRTWSEPRPRVFAGLDVYKTDEWAEMFSGVKRTGRLIRDNPNEFIAAVVDPDLIELRGGGAAAGVLVCAFGLRVPARANFAKPQHPWNGNYLAFSLDHGDTWPHVVRLTTGVSTTHYMAIEETTTPGELFVAYDFGHWTSKQGRYTYGRHVHVELKPS